jgi:hypothetical protein
MMKRRSFLQLLGMTGAMAGLGIAGAQRALADAGRVGAPRRLVVIGHCHGWPYDAWKIRPEGFSESEPWDVDLTTLSLPEWSGPLAPLYPFRHRLLIPDAFSLATAELDMDGNRHDTGWIQAWTGNRVDFSGAGSGATTASLDQIVAGEIARADRLQSLELTVGTTGGTDSFGGTLESGRPIAYSASGGALPVEGSAAKLWQRIYGPSLSPDPLGARQGSVLDFAYEEHAALAKGLSQQAEQRLAAHYEHLASLGERLEGMAGLACDAVPDAPEEVLSFDGRFDAFAELIGAAFACDVTRVVSVGLGEMPTADFGADGISDNVHKGIAHDIHNSPEKHAAMAEYVKVHAMQVGRLVEVLESLPDVDGGSIMDNTLIVWGSELADGWHGYQHYNPVLIGGAWHFNTGRYVYRPHTTPAEMLVPASVNPGGWSEFCGLPHQHLLVSVAQAMGLERNHVGLKYVQGQRGDWINTTGPMEGLA